MKRIISLLVLSLVCLVGLFACSKQNSKVIVVGASSTPHGVILEFAKPLLEAKGYTLKIVIYDDYVQPNLALDQGSLDANYFQHTPYLNEFNKGNGTKLTSAGIIHYEPLGLYGKDIKTVDESNKTVYIPNDSSNGTRALLLLAENGLITLKEGKNIYTGVTKLDVEDFKGLNIIELDAELIATTFLNGTKGTLAIINGNYALQAKIDLSSAIAREASDGEAANTYGNIIACQLGQENSDKIKALVEVLQSEEVKKYITDNFGGAVLPK